MIRQRNDGDGSLRCLGAHGPVLSLGREPCLFGPFVRDREILPVPTAG
jgi:hypothetical protein